MVRQLTRRQVIGSVGAAGLGASLLACGPSRSGRAARAPSPEGTPKNGGQLNLRASTDPFDWDLSYVGKSAPNGGGMSLAYNSLLEYKFGPDVEFADLTLKPALAESWEVSPDATR